MQKIRQTRGEVLIYGCMTSTLIAVVHGLLICIPFTLFVLISFVSNPRLWLHSLPGDIRQMAAPKTKSELTVTRLVLLPIYLLILPGLSVASVLLMNSHPKGDFIDSFPEILIHLYIIWITVHLWDLIVIDGIGLLVINPGRPPIKGTEGAKGWRDPWFHIRSFATAVMMSAIFVVPAAGLLAFLL
jgi:hypothetical protein